MADEAAVLEALRSPNATVRLDAALALQRMGGHLERTLPVLIDDIVAVDESREERWRWALKFIERPAIAALATKAADETVATSLRLLALQVICCEFYKDHGAATDLLRPLLDGDPVLGSWAAVILAKSGEPVHAHDAYIAALGSEDDKLVEEAVHALHNFKDRSAAEVAKVKAAVLPCLVHPNRMVRGNCCMFLPFEIDERDLQALDLADDAPIDPVMSLLARTKAPPPGALELSIRALFSPNFDTRESYAPIVLGKFGPQAIDRLLAVAVDTKNPPDARCAALMVLARTTPLPASIEEQMRPILEEEDKPSCYAAAVLARLGCADDVVIDRLIEGVASDDRDEHGSENRKGDMSACLKGVPVARSIPAVIAAMKDGDSMSKELLGVFLSQIGHRSVTAARALVEELTQAEDGRLRNRLANALYTFEERAVPAILDALTAPLRDEQIVWLLEGLEFLGQDAIEAVPQLLRFLEHANSEVVFFTAKAIAAIGPTNPASTPPLLQGLSSENRTRRYEVLNRLQCMGEGAAPFVPRLIELVDEPEFQDQAAQVLGWIGPVGAPAIPRLVELMNASNKSHQPIDSLGRIGHPDAVPHLVAALDNERKLEAVVQALGRMGSASAPAVAKLRTMLGGRYQLAVVNALARFGTMAGSAAGDLLPLLDDANKDVRLATIAALGSLGVGGERLLALAESADGQTSCAALQALGGPRPKEGIPLLMAAAASSDSEVARAAFQGLAGYGEEAPPEFVPLLMRRFEEGDEGLQWGVVYALQKLGPAGIEALPMMLPLLSAEHFYEMAHDVVGKMGPAASAALPELERLSNLYQYRHVARRAIERITMKRS